MNRWHILVLSVIIGFSSCRPEEKPDNPDLGSGNNTLLTLSASNFYQMQVGQLETQGTIEPVDYQVRIGTVNLPATLDGSKRLIFLLSDEVPAGAHKLMVQINGEPEKEFPIEVMALPVFNNPEEVVNEYNDLVLEMQEISETLYDSVRIWHNLPANPAVESTRKKISDSLKKHIQVFNTLSGPEKEYAAKIVQANLIELKPVMESIRDNAEAYLNNGMMGKNGSPCSDVYKKSAALQCAFSESKKDILRLLTVYPKAFIAGGIVGYAVGAYFGGPAGFALGGAVGFSIAAAIASDGVRTCLNSITSHFNTVFVVTENRILNKNELLFENGVEKTLNYSVMRRNIQPADSNSSTSFISEFIGAFNSIASWTRKNLPDLEGVIPSFKSVKTTSTVLEESAYLNISVLGNDKVILDEIKGTKAYPKFTFSTMESSDQTFSLGLSYNDGTFSVSNNYASQLKVDGNGGGGSGDSARWYIGRIELLQSVYPNCNALVGQSFKMYAAVKGQNSDEVQIGDKVVVYLKSVITGIPDMYVTSTLTDDGQGNPRFIINNGGADYSIQLFDLMVSNSSIVSKSTGSGAGRIFKNVVGAETPCFGSYLHYYNVSVDVGFGGTDASGDIPAEVAGEMRLRLQ